MKKKILISTHAKERLNEHGNLRCDDSMASNIILGMYYSSSPFGIQKGRQSELRLSYCKAARKDLVLACEIGREGYTVIKTILTMDHAIANSQMIA